MLAASGMADDIALSEMRPGRGIIVRGEPYWQLEWQIRALRAVHAEGDASDAEVTRSDEPRNL